MTIDVNMQLSHMISDGLGVAGTESAIIDTLSITKEDASEKDLQQLINNTLHIVISTADIHEVLNVSVVKDEYIRNQNGFFFLLLQLRK